MAAGIDSVHDLSVTNKSETADAMQEPTFIDVDDIASFQNNLGQADSSRFGREQLEDDLLSHAFSLARQGKGHYLLKYRILYSNESLYGQQLVSLVISKACRLSLLQLAHNSCHLQGSAHMNICRVSRGAPLQSRSHYVLVP